MKLVNLLEEETPLLKERQLKARRIFAYKLQSAFIEIGGKNVKIKFNEDRDIVSADCVVEVNVGEESLNIPYHYDVVLESEKIYNEIIFISFESEESDEPESNLEEYSDMEDDILTEKLKEAIKSHLEYFYKIKFT